MWLPTSFLLCAGVTLIQNISLFSLGFSSMCVPFSTLIFCSLLVMLYLLLFLLGLFMLCGGDAGGDFDC